MYKRQAHQGAFGDDGRGHAEEITVGRFGGAQLGVAGGVAVGLALFHQMLQILGIAFVQQVAARRSRQCNDGIAVGNGGNAACVFADGIADLAGKVGKVAHGRVLFKNDFAIFFRINFQGIALADAQGAANFLGNDNPRCV